MNSRILLLLFIPFAASAAEYGYVAKMIACSEKEERLVSQAYDAFLKLISGGRVEKDDLRFPFQWAAIRPEKLILSRGFYISPNELRGFELAIPKSCLVERDGIFVLNSAVTLENVEVRVGIRVLVLRKAE
jgi:hypothetical protein